MCELRFLYYPVIILSTLAIASLVPWTTIFRPAVMGHIFLKQLLIIYCVQGTIHRIIKLLINNDIWSVVDFSLLFQTIGKARVSKHKLPTAFIFNWGTEGLAQRFWALWRSPALHRLEPQWLRETGNSPQNKCIHRVWHVSLPSV